MDKSTLTSIPRVSWLIPDFELEARIWEPSLIIILIVLSDLTNGKETIIKCNKGQSNLTKAVSPAHWRFGLQS